MLATQEQEEKVRQLVLRQFYRQYGGNAGLHYQRASVAAKITRDILSVIDIWPETEAAFVEKYVAPAVGKYG